MQHRSSISPRLSGDPPGGKLGDTLTLKHVSRILGHCNNLALLVSHFQASIGATNRKKCHDHKPVRKAVLGQRILLTCFRARRSAMWLGGPSDASAARRRRVKKPNLHLACQAALSLSLSLSLSELTDFHTGEFCKSKVSRRMKNGNSPPPNRRWIHSTCVAI